MRDFTIARRRMVERQVIGRGISDKRVIDAMLTVPRHKFVEEALEGQAYQDAPLPIGEKQTISQPYMVAVMSEALLLEGTETVLEVGTGSGYQAAVLALMLIGSFLWSEFRRWRVVPVKFWMVVASVRSISV